MGNYSCQRHGKKWMNFHECLKCKQLGISENDLKIVHDPDPPWHWSFTNEHGRRLYDEDGMPLQRDNYE